VTTTRTVASPRSSELRRVRWNIDVMIRTGDSRRNWPSHMSHHRLQRRPRHDHGQSWSGHHARMHAGWEHWWHTTYCLWRERRHHAWDTMWYSSGWHAASEIATMSEELSTGDDWWIGNCLRRAMRYPYTGVSGQVCYMRHDEPCVPRRATCDT